MAIGLARYVVPGTANLKRASFSTGLACGSDKVVRTFENFAPKLTLSGHNDWVYSLAVAPDGKTVASGSWDGEVRTWSLPEGKPIRTILAAPGYKPEANAQASAR